MCSLFCTALADIVCLPICDDWYAVQAVYGGPSSSPQSYGGNYMYLPASPPSPTPSPQLFGITTPAAYSPSPYSPVTVPTSPAPAPYYSPPAAYSQPASPPTLFGGPRVSPPAVQSSPYASPAYYSPKPYAYGAKPYSPAVSSPYYGLTARGGRAYLTACSFMYGMVQNGVRLPLILHDTLSYICYRVHQLALRDS